jgi:hypothetical protein
MRLIIENEGDAELAARIVKDFDREESRGFPKHMELLCSNAPTLDFLVTLLDDGQNNGSKANYTNLELGFFYVEEDEGDGDDSGGGAGTSASPDGDGPP